MDVERRGDIGSGGATSVIGVVEGTGNASVAVVVVVFVAVDVSTDVDGD